MEPHQLLSELLSAQHVRVPLQSRIKAELLRELVVLALPDQPAEIVDVVLAAVEARELEGSTAMGRGLAVPHGRTNCVTNVRLSAGLVEHVPDYLAPDGVPVRVAFLVLSPMAETGAHVRVLARIARLMHSPASHDALVGATGAEVFVQVIRAFDGARAGTSR